MSYIEKTRCSIKGKLDPHILQRWGLELLLFKKTRDAKATFGIMIVILFVLVCKDSGTWLKEGEKESCI